MRTFLVTVGTSLQTNAERSGKTDLVRFLRETPAVDASAETNPLSLLGVSAPAGPEDRILFFHTATAKGGTCARALAAFYGGRATAIEIAEMTDQPGSMEHGIRALATALESRARHAQGEGREVLVVANGGYKPMTATATSFAMLSKLPVFYVHEEMKELVQIRPLPIAVDTEPFARYREVFSGLADCLSEAEYTALVRDYGGEAAASVERYLERIEGMVCLTPLAEAAWKGYVGSLDGAPTLPIFFSRPGRQQWDRLDETSRGHFRTMLERVAKDPRGGETKNNSDCIHFPGGGRAFGGRRLVYHRSEEGLTAAGFYLSHRDWERDLDAGRLLLKDHHADGLPPLKL